MKNGSGKQFGMWTLELVLLLPVLAGLLFWFGSNFKQQLTLWGMVFDEMKQFQPEVVCDPQGSAFPQRFASHDLALNEMLVRWHARTIVMMVPGLERRRVIDAWDGKVGNQIYYGPKTLDTDVAGQLEKDRLLLENHMMGIVVWHFFINPKTGTGGPDQKLRQALLKAKVGWMVYGEPTLVNKNCLIPHAEIPEVNQ